MFYSHEILTSRQHGVATIWLLANHSKDKFAGNIRGVTKNRILQVDVSKACNVVVDPGAPIALRLQAGLLFGLTRVYHEQCTYVFNDVVKLRLNMKRLALEGNSNNLDPTAGQTSRDRLMIPDDEQFDPERGLPPFDPDNLRSPLPVRSQVPGGGSESQALALLSSPASFRFDQDLVPLLRDSQRSSSLLSSLGTLPDFESYTPSAGKPGLSLPSMEHLLPTQEKSLAEHESPPGDLGLIIDEEGNIIQVSDIPAREHGAVAAAATAAAANAAAAAAATLADKSGEAVGRPERNVGGEQPLPDAEALPGVRNASDEASQGRDAAAARGSASAAALLPKKSRKHDPVMLDEPGETTIGRKEFHRLGQSYGDIMAAKKAESRKRKATYRSAKAGNPASTAARAWNFVFGHGIADVGRGNHGLSPDDVHPLAELFAGDALRKLLLPHILPSLPPQADEEEEQDDEQQQQARTARRRTAADAFDETPDQEGRRVRQRGEEKEKGKEAADEPSEVGRGLLGSALSETASLLPWNRASSAVPSSAAKGPAGQGSALGLGVAGSSRRQTDFSPLVGRGSIVHDIERLSVAGSPAVDSLLLGAAGPNSSDLSQSAADFIGTLADSDALGASDVDSKNFAAYVEHVAREKATTKRGGHFWFKFDDLFPEGQETKATAAAAFYNVLQGVTRGRIRVEQAGQGKAVYGDISIGVVIRDRATAH